jgi:hypothetical protein
MAALRKYENYDALTPDFEGLSLAELSEHERFLIMAIRVWAKGVRARVCPLRLLTPRLVMSGHVQLTMPLHDFMKALGFGAARHIDIAAHEHSNITDDEAYILAACASIVDRDLSTARSWLAALLTPCSLGEVTHKAVLMCAV